MQIKHCQNVDIKQQSTSAKTVDQDNLTSLNTDCDLMSKTSTLELDQLTHNRFLLFGWLHWHIHLMFHTCMVCPRVPCLLSSLDLVERC